MLYNFTIFKPEKKKPDACVSICSLGLGFNVGAITALGRPLYVYVAYDNENNLIGIKPMNSKTGNTFEFIAKEKNSYIRLSSKQLIKMLEKEFKVTFEGKTTRYFTYWNDELELLIVDIEKPLNRKGA